MQMIGLLILIVYYYWVTFGVPYCALKCLGPWQWGDFRWRYDLPKPFFLEGMKGHGTTVKSRFVLVATGNLGGRMKRVQSRLQCLAEGAKKYPSGFQKPTDLMEHIRTSRKSLH